MGIRFSNYLKKTRKLKVLVVGPDAAGKTTLLYRLKTGRPVTTIPTIGYNVEEVQIKRVLFTLWDVGGQDKLREMWKHYYVGVSALAFVVDSSDRERIREAQEVLESILMDPHMDNVLLLVYANKQDIEGAMNSSEVAKGLGLTDLCRQSWYVQPSCAVTGDGLYEGLIWAVNQQKKQTKRLKSLYLRNERPPALPRLSFYDFT